MKYPPLTKSQQDLVLSCQRLVPLLARKMFRQPSPDVISEGYLGLCMAAQRFDPTRGTKFSTYSSFWINARLLLMRFCDRSGPISFGSSALQRRVFNTLGRIRKEVGGDISAMAKAFGTDEYTLTSILGRINAHDVSLEDTVDHDGSAMPRVQLHDTSADTESSITDRIADEAGAKSLKKALKQLGAREQFILRTRYLSNRADISLSDVGKQLKISRERVRQIECEAIQKLKSLLKATA